MICFHSFILEGSFYHFNSVILYKSEAAVFGFFRRFGIFRFWPIFDGPLLGQYFLDFFETYCRSHFWPKDNVHTLGFDEINLKSHIFDLENPLFFKKSSIFKFYKKRFLQVWNLIFSISMHICTAIMKKIKKHILRWNMTDFSSL